MKRSIQNFAGGLAGAIALTLLHQALAKTVSDAPAIDRVGEEAMKKIDKALNIAVPAEQTLYNTTLAADIVSNGLYYSLAGAGGDDNIVSRALGLGLLAGVGATSLTKYLDIDDAPVAKTVRTKLMTVGYYVFGGWIAGIVIKSLRGNT